MAKAHPRTSRSGKRLGRPPLAVTPSAPSVPVIAPTPTAPLFHGELATDDDGAPMVVPGGSAEERRTPRLAVTLDDDGRVAWDRMRPETRETLRRALGTEAPGAPTTAGARLDPAIIYVAYDALTSIAVSVAAASGYTLDSAEQLRFSAREKAALLEPTQKVLAKYTVSLGRWEDEIMLAMILGATVQGKVAQLRRRDGSGAALTPTPAAGDHWNPDTVDYDAGVDLP